MHVCHVACVLCGPCVSIRLNWESAADTHLAKGLTCRMKAHYNNNDDDEDCYAGNNTIPVPFVVVTCDLLQESFDGHLDGRW